MVRKDASDADDDAEGGRSLRARRRGWVGKLERIGWRLALKHDFWAASKMEGKIDTVNKFYDLVSPLYDVVFRRLRGFKVGGARLVERVVQKGERILDLGCGTGYNLEHLQPVTSDIVGLDLNFGMLRKARQSAAKYGWKGRFLQGTATELPFPDASFDAVVSAYMMVYLDHEQSVQCLREVRRVLRPGGRLGLLCAQGEHSPRNPRREEWVTQVHEAGFHKVEFDDFWDVLRIVFVERGDDPV